MYYTVKDVAEMLQIGEETVRRWIRNGKLKAERGTGRQGSKIEECTLRTFIEGNRNLLTVKASNILGIGLTNIMNGLVSGIDVAENTISLLSKSKIMNIIKRNNSEKQMFEELQIQKLDMEKIAMQLKLEIAKQQNELRTLEEQVNIINEMLSK